MGVYLYIRACRDRSTLLVSYTHSSQPTQPRPVLCWCGLNEVSICSDLSQLDMTLAVAEALTPNKPNQLSQTFEELTALAEAGHEDKLNVRVTDVVSQVDGDSYSHGLYSELVIYSFGKTHGERTGMLTWPGNPSGLIDCCQCTADNKLNKTTAST